LAAWLALVGPLVLAATLTSALAGPNEAARRYGTAERLLITSRAPDDSFRPPSRPPEVTFRPYLDRLGPGFRTWFARRFDRYARKFVRDDGRVVDIENDTISHSEGQGFGMLLALEAGDRRAFSRIWRFARRELQREDGLFSWRYDPHSDPHVTDPNNATDGDILIATALGLAAKRWDRTDYWVEGARVATAISKKLIVHNNGNAILLPGEKGFHRQRIPFKFASLLGISQDASPVFNLSYWVFFAFPMLERLDPVGAWRKVEATGLDFLHRTDGLPSDWSVLSDARRVVPAPGRAPVFGYNAIRIPLYLILAGYDFTSLMADLDRVWGEPGRDVPFTFHHETGERWQPMNASGYRLVHALSHCVHTGEPVPMHLLMKRPDTYYSSSLYLLAVNALYTHHVRCFPAIDGNWP
jgi:endoglucanase